MAMWIPHAIGKISSKRDPLVGSEVQIWEEECIWHLNKQRSRLREISMDWFVWILFQFLLVYSPVLSAEAGKLETVFIRLACICWRSLLVEARLCDGSCDTSIMAGEGALIMLLSEQRLPWQISSVRWLWEFVLETQPAFRHSQAFCRIRCPPVNIFLLNKLDPQPWVVP